MWVDATLMVDLTLGYFLTQPCISGTTWVTSGWKERNPYCRKPGGLHWRINFYVEVLINTWCRDLQMWRRNLSVFSISFLYSWIEVLDLNQLFNWRTEIWEPFKMKLIYIWVLQSWTLAAHMTTSIPTHKTTSQYLGGHMRKRHIVVSQPLVTLKPAKMKEMRHVMARFDALSVKLLVVMLIVMTMLISLQGGDAELVHDHHHDSYKSLGPYFYHDYVNGTNVTDVIVVSGRGGSGFGSLTVFNDPLTETPEFNSTTVARSQGLQVVVRFSSALNFTTFLN